MDKYRTLFPRIVAFLIDSFILLPIGILDDWFRQAEFPALFFYLWIPVGQLVAPVYRIATHALYGQTLGKMALGVKVLSVAEAPIDFKRAFLRELPQLITGLITISLMISLFPKAVEAESIRPPFNFFFTFAAIWLLADFLSFILSNRRRALHDLLAGTVVVKTNL